MPDAQTMAENKTRSEARRLIMALRLRGMKNADIAHAIGVEPGQIARIVKGDARGDAMAAPLRTLVATHGVQLPSSNPASVLASGDPVPNETPAAPPDLTVEAPTADPDPRQSILTSIRNAALGRGPLVTAPSGAKPSGKGPNLAEQITPVAAIVIVLLCGIAIRDPYKPIAPTQQEANDILAMPIKWLCAELDAAGKLSERSLEVLAMLVAVVAYSNRATGTWRAIHAQQQGTIVDDHPSTNPVRAARRAEPHAERAGGPSHAVVPPEGGSNGGSGNPAHADFVSQYMRSLAENGMP